MSERLINLSQKVYGIERGKFGIIRDKMEEQGRINFKYAQIGYGVDWRIRFIKLK